MSPLRLTTLLSKETRLRLLFVVGVLVAFFLILARCCSSSRGTTSSVAEQALALRNSLSSATNNPPLVQRLTVTDEETVGVTSTLRAPSSLTQGDTLRSPSSLTEGDIAAKKSKSLLAPVAERVVSTEEVLSEESSPAFAVLSEESSLDTAKADGTFSEDVVHRGSLLSSF